MNRLINTFAVSLAAATVSGAPEAAPAMPVQTAQAASGEIVHYPASVVHRETTWGSIFAIINPRQIGWYASPKNGRGPVSEEDVYLRCVGGNRSTEVDVSYGKYPGHETIQNPSYRICANGVMRQVEKAGARRKPFFIAR